MDMQFVMVYYKDKSKSVKLLGIQNYKTCKCRFLIYYYGFILKKEIY